MHPTSIDHLSDEQCRQVLSHFLGQHPIPLQVLAPKPQTERGKAVLDAVCDRLRLEVSEGGISDHIHAETDAMGVEVSDLLWSTLEDHSGDFAREIALRIVEGVGKELQSIWTVPNAEFGDEYDEITLLKAGKIVGGGFEIELMSDLQATIELGFSAMLEQALRVEVDGIALVRTITANVVSWVTEKVVPNAAREVCDRELQ